MTAALASLVAASFFAAVTPPTVPVSPERLAAILAKIDQSRPWLAKGLESNIKSCPVSSEEIQAITLGGPTAAKAISALAADRAKPFEVRATAVSLLAPHLSGPYAVPDPVVVKGIVAALKDLEVLVRRAAANGIHGLGMYHLPTEPVAWRFFQRAPSPAVLAELAPVLAAAVADPDAEVCCYACRAIRCNSLAGVGVKEALTAIRRKDPSARVGAIGLLATVGRDDPAALPAVLGELRKDNDTEPHGAAVWAVGKFGPMAKEAVPELARVVREATDTDDLLLVLGAIRSLGDIGPDAREAVPTILAHLKKDWVFRRQDVLRDLVRIDAETGTRLMDEYMRQLHSRQ